MSDSSTPEPEDDFVCNSAASSSACQDEPFYGEHENKLYCVLHFPGKKKSEAFQAALQRKLDAEDFDFSGVWFPDEAPLSGMNFSTDVDFSSATFSAGAAFDKTTFSARASFNDAIFNGNASFWMAIFCDEANFGAARFSPGADAIFIGATFAAADFNSATFGADAHFTLATFKAADFSSTTFADHARFEADENTTMFAGPSSLNLQFAIFEKPDHVSFHTLTLHPHWFVNVNARKFDFINVHWKNIGRAKQEIELLEKEAVWSTNRLLAIACRKLAANAEENDRYREASHFRRMAMDAERLATWRGFGFMRLDWWYWLASGYGERPFQALMVLIGILIVFAALYTRVGFARWEPKLASEADVVTAKRDSVGSPMAFSRALAHSASVMTLQKPEPRPATTWAQTVVLLETILGPVQAALLALAIRRKFMR